MKRLLPLVATLVVAQAAAATNPNPPIASGVCLIAAGQTVDFSQLPIAYNYPEIVQEIWWQKGAARDNAGTAIMFTRSVVDATHLKSRFLIVGHSFGYTRSEVARMVGQTGAVVWVTNSGTGLRASDAALLRSCVSESGTSPQTFDLAGYVRVVNSINRGLRDSFASVLPVLVAPFGTSDLVDLQRYSRLAVDELAQVRAPSRGVAAQARFAKALVDFASGLEPFVRELKSGKTLTAGSLNGLAGTKALVVAQAALGKVING
jgi:hypothetical protein